MRSFPWALALVLFLLPAVSVAEDAPTSPAKADPKVPLYSIEFLMPTDEDVPEGWSRSRKIPSGAPSEDALYELAESCGLDEDSFYVEVGALQKATQTVGFAMIDVDRKVWDLRAKLDAQVAAAGWTQRELGSPTRLLLIGGSGDFAASAMEALTEHVVYRMAELAMERVRGRSGNEEAGREAAVAYAEGIRAAAPGSGVAHAILGIVDWIESRPKKRGEQPSRKVEDLALASFAKALADGTRYPPRKSVRVFVAGQLGSILLARKEKAVLEQATRALEIAVENERDGKDNSRRFGHRYDLACAYARAARIDEAFGMLEKAIETGKSLPPNEWRGSYEHMREKDPDMAPLRADPRFSKLMSDNEPPKPKNPHGRMPPKNPHGGASPKNPHGGMPPKDPHHRKPPNDPHHKQPGDE